MAKDKQIVIRKWEVFELFLKGKEEGNPFTDYEIKGVFETDGEKKEVKGFYDGNGMYGIRFMPSCVGTYSYKISGSFSDEVTEGEFTVKAPLASNHGPVRVTNTFNFEYADQKPYYSVGTTCYVWELQNDRLIKQTLASLKKSGFNKIRFCIFPKHYNYNLSEPRSYPFVGTPMDSVALTPDNFSSYTGKTKGNDWKFDKFNPAHFRHIEKCIKELGNIGVEADLILFHPYDRWGFSQMTREQDTRYLEYVINRFSAFKNVWWSLANEFDIMEHKTDEDWKYLGEFVKEQDPYNHLRSIHNCLRLYNHNEDWVTHVSFQRVNLYKTSEAVGDLRKRYNKPIVLDEIAYEGNIQYGWGNITGEEMVRRFWEGALRGGHPGHGETFLAKDNILWWSHGGKLKGNAWKRVKFLRSVLKDTPGNGLKNGNMDWDCLCGVPDDDSLFEETGYRIVYFGFMRPSFREFNIRDGYEYSVEVIDTWNMTIKKVEGNFSGSFKIDLPGRQYMAIRLTKIRS